MQDNLEAPSAPHTSGSSPGPLNRFSWRAALLGAAVGIAGPSYFGTLFSNVTLWVLLGRGSSMQDAYAYLFQYNLSFPVVAHLVADIFFSVASGWVSAAYSRGASISQGVATGLIVTSFPIIMLLSPTGGSMPAFFRVLVLAVPVLGSIAGAYAYSRRT